MQASAMGADLSSRCLTGGAAALRCRSTSSSTAQARACAPRPGVAHAALSVEAPKTETGDIREQAHRRGALALVFCTGAPSLGRAAAQRTSRPRRGVIYSDSGCVHAYLCYTLAQSCFC